MPTGAMSRAWSLRAARSASVAIGVSVWVFSEGGSIVLSALHGRHHLIVRIPTASDAESGEPGGDRTHDQGIKSPLLYR